MKFKSSQIHSDLTIVGAGMPGICAAIEASRQGLKVVLINNRGFLGGNASPEIRIDICGADGSSEFNFYARETGIIEELRLENLYRNPQGNPYLWHTVLIDFICQEKNIQVFMNTNIDEVVCDKEASIQYVAGSQLGTEKHFEFHSPLFLDDTGDGTVGYLAGAEYRIGREARSEFGESIAPEVADEQVLLSTLSFYSKDTGRPAPFTLPKFSEDNQVREALDFREIPDKIPGHSRYENFRMQWFYETGHGLDQIGEAEEVINEHRHMIYGIWDHIKNSGDYDAGQYDMEYMSPVPGKRESRRLVGDYLLNERDIANQTDFEDIIGYGGWSIDLHALEGFFDNDLINRHYILNGVYPIPLRSCYSLNVPNLMIASRCISTTHVAFGSTRVMATLSVLGQAMASVATLCKKYKTTPRAIGEKHIDELQSTLVTNDLYVIGKKNEDCDDLIRKATLTASSTTPLALTARTGALILQKNSGLILPVIDSMTSVDLLLKSTQDTMLNYKVYTSTKLQNYKPQKELMNGRVTLKKTDIFTWATLPINVTTDMGKIFIELEANPNIQLATCYDGLNGVFFVAKKPLLTESTYTNLETHEILHELWQAEPTMICFRGNSPEDVYSVNNLSNGYHRNHGQPNLWLSEAANHTESIFIAFDTPKAISRLDLTFDSNLNFYYDNLEIYHDFNVMPELVKEYKVFYKDGNDYELLTEVTANHQRVNHLSFDTITSDSLKIVFENTNGASRFGIYEVRAYK